jgi:hypothetical protein
LAGLAAHFPIRDPMTRKCPACGQESSGRFCSNCGTSLEAAVSCAECGNELPPGGRFCNQCGAPTAATQALLAERRSSAGSPLPWVIAGIGGAAAVALLVVLLTRGGEEGAAAAPIAPMAGAAGPVAGAPVGDPSQVDIASMTPRERADRLYDRVMRLASAGDSAQARTFLPMALAAYQMVPEIDADARYHLGVLALMAGDAAGARAQADTLLAASPDHLFGLYNAAEAERLRGNEAAARQLLQRFLAVYDEEVAKGLPEYSDHAPALDAMRQEASRTVDSL